VIPARAFINILRQKPLFFWRSDSGAFLSAGRIVVCHSSRRGSTYWVYTFFGCTRFPVVDQTRFNLFDAIRLFADVLDMADFNMTTL
jgi:hypothetical protein